jgi:hypothetical protein
MTPRERLLRAGFWTVPPLAAVWFHWLALKTWFLGDDFAWLIHSTEFYNFHEFLVAVFKPMAQGTIRPWSDRIFFIVFYRIFGLDPLPFHIWAMLTQCANILLLLAIVRRLTGSRLAAWMAALIWTVNTSQPIALAWTSAYNEPLCALFILGAFHFLLRYLETGQRRYWIWQWVIYLLGFGALELNVIYPALASAYTLLCARKYFVRTLPLFAPAVLYTIVHSVVAPTTGGAYVMHFGAPMLKTFYAYWSRTLAAGFLASMIRLPGWQVTGAIALMTLGLMGGVLCRAWKGDRLPLFGLLWFLFLIAPVLPLTGHVVEYYPFLGSLGLAIAAGWLLALARRQPLGWRLAAAIVALVYIGYSVDTSRRSAQWEYRRSQRVRRLIQGVQRAHELHPGKIILIDNVDEELFWTGFIDHPFKLLDVDYLYLTPGSDRLIIPHPELGDVNEFIIPQGVAWKALMKEKAVVYRVEPERLRNITNIYANAAPPQWENAKPSRLDLSNPAEDYLLGPEWHEIEVNHRWMPRRATLEMAAPRRAGASLHLVGGAGKSATQVVVTIGGIRLPERKVTSDKEFDLTWPLPDAVVGKAAAELTIETDGTFTVPLDGRPLGLVFGVIEIIER